MLTICAREGCDQPAKRIYCSNRCANQGNGAKRDRAFFQAIGRKGAQARIEKGCFGLRPAERALLEAGQFDEAERLIRHRSYAAGWMAHKKGCRQMPERKASGSCVSVVEEAAP